MITSSDIENELNSEGNVKKFNADNHSVAVQRAINGAVSQIKANLNENYRRMLTVISGLQLTKGAVSGEVEFDLPAGFTFTQAYVWKNYCGVWRDRDIRDCVSATLSGDLESGYKLTLADALDEDDTIVCDLFHSNDPAPELLKKYCLDLAVNQLCRTIRTLVADSDRMTLDSELIHLREDLRLLRRGELRIDEWDDLKLINEMETISRVGYGVRGADGW